jgi:hypothetical protein
MKINVKTILGGVEYNFEFDEKDDMDALHKASVLGNPPIFCNECQNDNKNDFKLYSNKDKESNTYVNVICNKCDAQAKLGLYKSGGFFWHDFQHRKPKE